MQQAPKMARDDYETRHKRQRQGIAKAKGKYRGRRVNEALHQDILQQARLNFLLYDHG